MNGKLSAICVRGYINSHAELSATVAKLWIRETFRMKMVDLNVLVKRLVEIRFVKEI